MARFGDFTLLEDLGRSASADRFKAVHDTQGGPFFLKVYARLEPTAYADLAARCDRLIGLTHPNLAPHLGHGVQDGVPFVVSPYLDGIDLKEFAGSLKDRRVSLGLDAIFLVVRDLARAVSALHQIATDATGTLMAHGAVQLEHVRLGTEGQVWLTGLTTPRGAEPGRVPDGAWDLAGTGALVYDLLPLVRTGARTSLPPSLDRLVRRSLGIGAKEEMLAAPDLAAKLGDALEALKLKADRKVFAELVQRTARAVDKKLKEAGGRPPPVSPPARDGRSKGEDGVRAAMKPARVLRAGEAYSPADDIPSLDPLDVLPTLEPIHGAAAVPAPILELEPIDGLTAEPEAHVRLIPAAQRTPPRTPGAGRPALERPREVSGPAVRPAALGAMPRSEPKPPPIAAPPAYHPLETTPFDDGLPPDIVTVERTSPGRRLGELPTDLPTDPVAPRPEPPARPPAPPAPPREARSDPSSSSWPPTASPVPSSSLAAASAAAKTGKRRSLFADPDDPSAGHRAPQPRRDPVTDEATDPAGAARTVEAARTRAVAALANRGLVTEDDIERAARIQAQRGGRLVEVLVAEGSLTDAAVADALAEESGTPRIGDAALMGKLPSPALVRRLPQTYALGRRILPLSLDPATGQAGARLVLAMANPFEDTVVDEVKKILGASLVEVNVAARAALTAATIEAYKATGIGAVPGALVQASTVMLCVADDARAGKIGARLVQEGYRVELVADVVTAKEILSTRAPDAVLCAHELAGASTDEILLLARESDDTHQMPFYVLGPRGDDGLVSRMLDLGADDFFTEPLRLDVVMAKLRRALQKNSRGGAQGANRPITIPPEGPDALSTTEPMPKAPSGRTDPPLSAPPARASSVAPAAMPSTAPSAFLAGLHLPSLADLPDLPPPGMDPLAPNDLPAMPTGVMGTLKQMSVSEIVQSLEMGRKTARVELVPASGNKGTMAFDGGQICYAQCGEKSGDLAFYELARHTEGYFRIHYGEKPTEKNIDAPTTFLLLEAMRRMDEEGVGPAPA